MYLYIGTVGLEKHLQLALIVTNLARPAPSRAIVTREAT